MAQVNEDLPLPTHAKFLIGGSAGMMAAFCLHPMDVMKIRLQMNGAGSAKKLYRNTVVAFISVIKHEGILALYSGVSACLLRQCVYTTTRVGVYTTLFDFSAEDLPPTFATKASMGMFSGFLAGFLATPVDLCVIRMVSDGAKPPNERCRYKHVFNALYRIAKEEGGLYGLFRGAGPTTVRAIAVNGSSLATYSQAKEFLIEHGYGKAPQVYLFAAAMSGLLTTFISLPIDAVKTRIQAQKTGKKITTSEVLLDVLSKEGPLGFWKGITPYFIRLAPFTVLMFIFFEQLTYLYHIYVLGNKISKSAF